MNILLTNPGRRTYIVSFLLELRSSYPDLVIHLADCNHYSASKYVSKLTINHLAPPVLADGDLYIQSILSLCASNNIQAVIPLSDLDLSLLSINKDKFLCFGCRVIVSDPLLIANCFDKRRFSHFCAATNILTPPIIPNPENWTGNYPIVKKHILGSGSSGLMILNSPNELSNYDPSVDCLQEYISGQEYGIDILNDLSGNFVSACVKKKLLLRSGETDIAEVVHNPRLLTFASHLSSITRHIGNLDCDVIIDEEHNQVFSIDFNPRIGGGYPATHLSGLNYLNAILCMLTERPISFPDAPELITVIKGISLHST